MTSASTLLRPESPWQGFRHEALLYPGEGAFVAAVLPFVRGAVAAGEPILIVVSGHKIDLLRQALGDDAQHVLFADMADVGANPARIIPAWVDFVAEYSGGQAVRGIGEPIYPDRTPAELVECEHHEALLNVAFADPGPFWLVCPYDTEALDPAVIEEAHRNHPYVRAPDGERPNAGYREPVDAGIPFQGPLPAPPNDAPTLPFGAGPLDSLREFVAAEAGMAGLSHSRVADLVLAVNEIATNSLRYGGGSGNLRVWCDAGAFVCDVRDQGQMSRPLVGRERPPSDRLGGRGVWLANQLCDLVQIRSSAQGTVVRLTMWR
jgi:anti-sigma regulatory factor (Ser/Thr protein kinase)